MLSIALGVACYFAVVYACFFWEQKPQVETEKKAPEYFGPSRRMFEIAKALPLA
jgi:hypothetical protein